MNFQLFAESESEGKFNWNFQLFVESESEGKFNWNFLFAHYLQRVKVGTFPMSQLFKES